MRKRPFALPTLGPALTRELFFYLLGLAAAVIVLALSSAAHASFAISDFAANIAGTSDLPLTGTGYTTTWDGAHYFGSVTFADTDAAAIAAYNIHARSQDAGGPPTLNWNGLQEKWVAGNYTGTLQGGGTGNCYFLFIMPPLNGICDVRAYMGFGGNAGTGDMLDSRNPVVTHLSAQCYNNPQTMIFARAPVSGFSGSVTINGAGSATLHISVPAGNNCGMYTATVTIFSPSGDYAQRTSTIVVTSTTPLPADSVVNAPTEATRSFQWSSAGGQTGTLKWGDWSRSPTYINPKWDVGRGLANLDGPTGQTLYFQWGYDSNNSEADRTRGRSSAPGTGGLTLSINFARNGGCQISTTYREYKQVASGAWTGTAVVGTWFDDYVPAGLVQWLLENATTDDPPIPSYSSAMYTNYRNHWEVCRAALLASWRKTRTDFMDCQAPTLADVQSVYVVNASSLSGSGGSTPVDHYGDAFTSWTSPGTVSGQSITGPSGFATMFGSFNSVGDQAWEPNIVLGQIGSHEISGTLKVDGGGQFDGVPAVRTNLESLRVAIRTIMLGCIEVYAVWKGYALCMGSL